ncbi:MAG: hypothetical protein E7580_08810 [Ruminococcaceae bacterium]|nr:hypothetical protein [Oscillospiraceae bacterium]
MKRVAGIVLCFLILTGLCSCQTEVQKPALVRFNLDKASIEAGAVHTDFEGMEIRIVNAVWNDDEIRLDINWTNGTEYDALFGESYAIERKENGEWISCVTIENLAFNLVGYELRSGATQKKSYELTDVFDISENGSYRFSSDCFIYEKGRGGESTKCRLSAEFSVTRTGDVSQDVKKTFIDFVPQFIRTDGPCGDRADPLVKLIRSVDELRAYYQANKDRYDLERKEPVYSDTTVGFLDACDRYDSTFFEDRQLVMVILCEPSGSNRHSVDYVKASSDGKLHVSIQRIVPEVGTCDLASWHVLIEVKKEVSILSEADITVYLDGENLKMKARLVSETGAFSGMTLSIPQGWSYATERGYNPEDYCIAFWPDGQTKGKIKLWYYGAFGVCGTGLEVERITLGAYEAEKGTYDGSAHWSFISFADLPGFYVATNDGAHIWWDEYGEEAVQILSSANLAEGILSRRQAIELAKKKVTVEYDQTDASFDTEKGYWTVSFSKKNTLGGDQVFTITHEGKIIDIQYGD